MTEPEDLQEENGHIEEKKSGKKEKREKRHKKEKKHKHKKEKKRSSDQVGHPWTPSVLASTLSCSHQEY